MTLATRAALGEEQRIAKRPMDVAMAVNVAATAALLVAMVAAHQRRAVPAAAATALEMGLLMAYWELMARYYKGAALGTGRFEANRQTAMTNFVAALAQTEAAMELFREQRSGHLVMISSISALRGMRKTITTYAATKAGVAALAEGLINENVKAKGIDVSVIYPGYIRSEMNDKVAQKTKFMVDTETGVRAMVAAIEKRKEKAYVPAWPWVPIGFVLRNAPMSVVRKLS